MIVTWKFPLTLADVQTIEMPEGASVLTVQTQRENPFIWALVDTEAEKEDRTFYIVGTGHQIYDPLGRYIGTFQQYSGAFVGHVFEKRGGE